MKVCPECGYVDRSMWRQNKWRTNVEFIKDDYPEDIPHRVLYAYYIGKNMYVVDKFYAYRLCKKNWESNGIIERILIEEWEGYGEQGFHLPREKPP